MRMTSHLEILGEREGKVGVVRGEEGMVGGVWFWRRVCGFGRRMFMVNKVLHLRHVGAVSQSNDYP